MLKNIFSNFSLKCLHENCITPARNIHTTHAVNGYKNLGKRVDHFKSYNDKVFPPQSPDEPRRPAYVCHAKENVKYSNKKLWYIACLIRGMTIDAALRELLFVHKKGAQIIRETLLEAQEMAVKEHNVEFKNNLWVSESFSNKGIMVKGMRRHAKRRAGEIRYGYCHYFVTLEEGKPPEHYYYFNRPTTAEEKLDEWLKEMRDRKIMYSL